MGWVPRYLCVLAATLVATQIESFLPQQCRKGRILSDRRILSTRLAVGRKRNLSASEQERRDEERRRLERADDVKIGKTSAIDGEKNYRIDPKATEQEWMRQASDVEQEVFRQTDRGMEMLKMLRLEEAVDAFDAVFALKPNAYLWQAGIAKFYIGDLEGAADIFAQSAEIYETRFGQPASEERIWRYACELKLLNSMSRKDRQHIERTGGFSSTLTPLPEKDNTADLLKSEMRRVIRIARGMFEASTQGDDLKVIASRAKLKSIGGAFDDEKPVLDRKMWKLNSWYFLGLHYDVLGEAEESRQCMKMAIRLCPSSGNGSDIIHTLPMLHMSRRDWFDDESFDLNESNENLTENSEDKLSTTPSGVDPVFADSIRSNLAKMRHVELKDALKSRGLRIVGSKEELCNRLFVSMLNDHGLLP